MKFSRITSILIALCNFFNTAWSSDWSYKGEKGASRWVEHHKECGGENQSPVNIKTDSSQFDPYLSELTVYSSTDNPGRMVLIHNGHTLQVNTKGDHYVYGGKLPSNYRVAQFHLHWGKHDLRGSEHKINGRHYPMELHIVAYDYLSYNTIGQAMKSPMGLAVLGTLFTISEKDNPALEPLLSAVKHVRDPDEKYTTDINNLELRDLLPSSLRNYYRYNGSLTTPGCYESVLWTVFEETQTISQRQIKILREILRSVDSHAHSGGHGKLKITERVKLVDNFRPVQPLNGRHIYRSFTQRGDLPTASLKTQHASWSYKGDTGPMKWHEMYPDGGCGGLNQSPINIPEHQTQFSDTLKDFQIDSPAPETKPQMTVLNNGHTIKVAVGNGAGDYYVRGGGLPDNSEYKVAQLHFHWGGEDNKGSEHHVNGHAYPIELHIVTFDSKNYASIKDAATQPQGLAVLGVLFEVEHDDNLALQPLEDVMERVTDPEDNSKISISALDLTELLPDDTSQYFRYSGSLTTPGCYESVVWTVFKMTQTLSHKQLRQFREVLKHQDDHGEVDKVLPTGEPSPGHGGSVDDTLVKVHGDVLRERLIDNYRPIQPVNDRTILRSYQIIGSKRRKSGSHGHHWSYTGHNGPDHWPAMSEGCKGIQQSPINIITSKTEYNPRLPGFTLYDTPSNNSEMAIINNGHTVQVNVKKGEHYVYGGGLSSTYQTVQLHFHWGSSDDKGSEHTVDGQAFPLELHVVNYDSGKYSNITEAVKQPHGLAVLGTFFYISDEDNPVLQPILDGFLHVTDPDDKVEEVIEPFSIEDLLPADTSKYYRYNGSLTTPGCFESVVWSVFKDKIPISPRQMEMFRDILLPNEDEDKAKESGSHGEPAPVGEGTPVGTSDAKPVEIGHSVRVKMVDNFRPVQPLNERRVWRSFKVAAERRKKKTKHWSYEGAHGPETWASLYPDKNCDGKKQSPINIARNKTKFDPSLRDLNIWYDPPLPGSKMVATNNGHTVKVSLDGKYFITGAGLTKVYKSAQFHFHWGSSTKMGSEHTVDDQAFPLELHIVNYDSESYSSIAEAITEPMGLAVLGVFYTLSTEDNPTLQRVIEALEHIEDPASGKEVELEPISVKYFLPRDRSRYYRYNGSLTTPGCYESVIWTVFEETQTISRKQLEKFWNMFQMDHGHADQGPKYDTYHGKPANQTEPSGGSVVLERPGTSTTHTRKPKGRKRIKSNFRPVQSINERQVYRSFENLDVDGGRAASSKMCNGKSKISHFSLQVLILISLTFTFISHL